jgi:LmbE family N-acetylglucosaminyl deacetylase
VPYTIVSFHAHPDDEVLLTGGTLARAASQGHRVVLVTATAGEAGLTSRSLAGASRDLGQRRMAELRRAAATLGCHEVHLLGYDDSGMDGRAGRDGLAFARVGVQGPATRLAGLLETVAADVLTVYDRAGGYGHPDHVQVHRVGVRAAELAGTPVVLEATVDRQALQRILRIMHRFGVLRWAPAGWRPERLTGAYTEPAKLTHRVDVGRFAGAKRAAMQAHRSQRHADAGSRSLQLYLKLPWFVYRRVFRYEWFTERGRTPQRPLLGNVFDTLDHTKQ